MRKWVSFFLALMMLFAICMPAFAAEAEAQEAAEVLYSLGLFKGTGTDASGKPVFDLSRAPTRVEAVTMLVRLLGKEDDARSGSWEIPFTDVADWAKPYVGYAYASNLTRGIGGGKFGSTNVITATEYITLVLRAMGYSSDTDFNWSKAWELSDKLGITGGMYNADTKSFTRGDMAYISYKALSAVCKNSDQTLKNRIFSGVSDSYSLLGTSSIPKELGERKLTDSQIGELKDASLDTLKAGISTFADFVAWLDICGGTYYSTVCSAPGGQRTFGGSFSYQWVNKFVSSNMTTSLAMYILEDDYPGMGIAAAFYPVGSEGMLLASNYFPVDGGYIVAAPDSFSRIPPRNLPLYVISPLKLSSFNSLFSFCTSRDNNYYGDNLSQIFLINSSRDIVFEYMNGQLVPQDGSGVVSIYAASR